MNRGLTTLMTVAIALVSVQAMAVAPTIYDIPSPVIGNKSGTTSQPTKYVYADAFDLTKMADDNLNNPATDPSLLKWSYEIVGTPKYKINGLDPINSTTGDVINPPDSLNINKTLDSTKETKDGDSKPNTITIRNVNLAPYTGTGNTAAVGFVDKQAVTFWCSNGAAVSSETVMFYTDNQTDINGNPTGWNRLSQSNLWKMEAVDGNVQNWVTQTDWFGSVTTTTVGTSGKGLCFNVPKPGNNMGSVQSKYGFFTLADNMVYRIRATMNCSQGTVGKTPFWDFIVENYGSQNGVTKGLNLYGMDSFYLDNEGGANAVISSQAGTEFTMIFAPIAFQTPQWRSSSAGLYTTKYAADKDPYLRFRIMDAVANPGLMSDQKFGSLCLQQVVVESVPANRFVDDAVLYDVTAPRAANNNDKLGNMYASALLGSTISYPSNNVLNIQPSQNAFTAELVTVFPAVDTNGQGGSNIVPPYTQIADDWPIAWSSNQILRMDVDLTAPDNNSQSHPFDVIWLSMEPPTNELDVESFVTANSGIGSPKTTKSTYTFYYFTGNETKSLVSQLHFLRWRVRFGNSASLNFPQASDINNNSGSVRVNSVKISKVHVQ
jgi:hypothetical protein